MRLLALLGAFVVTLSLLTYGIGIITLKRYNIITRGVLCCLSLGIVLDIGATTLMIIGAQSTPFTLHGFTGYSAFLVMLVDVIFVWKVYLKNGKDAKVSANLQRYSKYAYVYWVIAYLTGSLLVIWK